MFYGCEKPDCPVLDSNQVVFFGVAFDKLARSFAGVPGRDQLVFVATAIFPADTVARVKEFIDKSKPFEIIHSVNLLIGEVNGHAMLGELVFDEGFTFFVGCAYIVIGSY